MFQTVKHVIIKQHSPVREWKPLTNTICKNPNQQQFQLQLTGCHKFCILIWLTTHTHRQTTQTDRPAFSYSFWFRMHCQSTNQTKFLTERKKQQNSSWPRIWPIKCWENFIGFLSHKLSHITVSKALLRASQAKPSQAIKQKPFNSVSSNWS